MSELHTSNDNFLGARIRLSNWARSKKKTKMENAVPSNIGWKNLAEIPYINIIFMSAFIHCLLLCKANWGKERGISPKKASFVHPEGAERGFATSVFIGRGGGYCTILDGMVYLWQKFSPPSAARGRGGGHKTGCRGGIPTHPNTGAHVWISSFTLYATFLNQFLHTKQASAE